MTDRTEAERMRAIAGVYAAINSADLPAVTLDFDPDIRWIEPAERGGGRNCLGPAAVIAHLTVTRATWAEGGCMPVGFLPAGERVVAVIHIHVRLKDRADWVTGDIADVFTFRDGRIVEIRSFEALAPALDFAGLPPTAAG